MSAPREIELKLECDGPDLAALASHPLLQGEGTAEHVTSTYFDTAGRDLRAAGLTLRVRRQGDRRVQTVKAGFGEGAALFDRSEWESEIAGDRPDVSALAGTPVARLLDKAGSPDLEPQFSSVVMRTARSVSHGTARIGATLDEGRIETPQGDAPLCELELELEAGDPADLFAMAQSLAETVSLRLGVQSKSERGFARLEDRWRRPSKAGAVVLPEEATAAQAFRLVAQACLRHLRFNEAVFLAGRDPEALHQIRVALRRLRSAFSLFKPILAQDPRSDSLRDEIKRVTEPFGRARNLDVFLETTLPAEIARRPDEPGLQDLRERLVAERDRAHDAVLATLASPEWRSLLLDLVTWIETGPWLSLAAPPERDASARSFAAQVLERFRRRVKRRGRHLARLDPEARHRVRIAAKKLRYGADFFASLYPAKKARKRHKAFASALSDLQDHLGALNDLATAHAVMAGLADGEAGGRPASGAALFAAGLTAADGEARTDALLEAAAEAHEDLIDVKPFWR
ncbi:CHAD domain-containing protein [Methylobacterium nigriterrae]|uniref:CYTH and CHAD domain-containing protein n=1 Tax=Methylobacterium nigriterrae TaxID=3127512 RepID=UPI003013BB7B